MSKIIKIYKKDIPSLMNDSEFWSHSFLAISKQRLWSHYNNPKCKEEDIVLLLAYLKDEIVGYMGVYTDEIKVRDKEEKIGWLSTWWVHPKTKGTGIGRKLLNTMYETWNGKIGISQFTESAKRVYDRSGYFISLKDNKGVKAVMKANLSYVLPVLYPKLSFLEPFYKLFDLVLNILLKIKVYIFKIPIQKKIKDVIIEYLPYPDQETRVLIDKYGKNDIANKDNSFFNWLKTYKWVYEAPLIDHTEKEAYTFSMYDKSFEYFFIKVKVKEECKGFLVLQKRYTTLKVLFTYYNNEEDAGLMTNVIKLHAIKLNIQEVICYETEIVKHILKSKLFLYKRKRVKKSIISKSFGVNDFEDKRVNYGDGDCAFA